MTTTKERTFAERIAWSNVDTLKGEIRRLRREVANLLDNDDALRASTVPIPPPGIVAIVEEAQWTCGTLTDEDLAWIREVRVAMRTRDEGATR